MKKCPNCGEEVEEDIAEMGLCSNCAEEVDLDDIEDDEAKDNETDE